MAGDTDRPDTEEKEQEQGSEGSSEQSASEEKALSVPGSEDGGALEVAAGDEAPEDAEDSAEDQLATQLGVQKYVHAAFFAAGILSAYLLGKVLQAAWNSLAEWPDAVRQFPVLLEYTEDERGSITLVIGAVLGVLLILRYYRRPSVRSWATDVAGELARVTWPSKDTVTNGTIVVLVAGAVATFYVAILDRLWSYLTNLVYGT